MDAEQAKFEGWALIELYGHAREAGYVSTVYFGSAAMFRVDVPEIPARQEVAERPRYFGDKLCPSGTIVEAEAIPGRTRFIGPGAVYAMNPSSEEAARTAVAQIAGHREVKIIHLPPVAVLAVPEEEDHDDSYMEPEEDEDEEEIPI